MTWDAVIIGSGFGGVMAATPLVEAGWRVLMLERGGWVPRGPENWTPDGVGLVTPHYSMESPYDVTSGRRRYRAGSWHCVGGQSVFYGGASFRFRERDFEHDPEIVGSSGAAWPFGYAELEPFYSRVERMLHIAGDSAAHPTEPPRAMPYPQLVPPLTRPAHVIADAARRLGLHPSRIPLAISYDGDEQRGACVQCGTCDGYACAADAKNDLATAIIPRLIARGMTLRTNAVVVRLVRQGSRIAAVEFVDRVTRRVERAWSTNVVLAAGALATPHLLLASDLARVNPAGHAVGRYLTRHRNAVVLGVFFRPPNPEQVFDKQVAILDYYFGDDAPDAPAGRLGSIQQLTPPAGLARAYLPWILKEPGALLATYSSGLLAIAEDQPQHGNGVSLDPSAPDAYGMPGLRVHHRYSPRDEAAARTLVRRARRIVREAGARFTLVRRIETFSHALGTVRMGSDPGTAPLDAYGRYHGIDNLIVSDGSSLPRSAGLNPSLTIAANALRIGYRLANAGNAAANTRQLPIHQPLTSLSA